MGVDSEQIACGGRHADLADLSPPFVLKAEVGGEGAAAAFRLTPAK